MSDIFKICLLKKDKIDKIYVFYGSNKLHDGVDDISPDEYFKMEPNASNFKTIFSDDELKNISTNKIPVKFINLSIHLDDTIEEIKRKIVIMLDSKISFDEIYLFGLKKEKVDLVTSYQNLTQNEKLDLTKERMSEFLLNFESVDISSLEDKEIYDYSDLLTLKFKDFEFIKKPVGQKFFVEDLTYIYTINPFDVIIYDEFLENYAENIISTLNRTLLLEFGIPKFKTLYCCLAEDVYEYMNEAQIPNLKPDITSKIYFPFLFKKKIFTIEDLKKNKLTLLSENKKLLNKYSEKKSKISDLMYDIFYNKNQDLILKTEGIKSIEFIIHPSYKYILPIDIIFKLIHASKNIPFIKLNPGNRKEKLYRIYTTSISSDGRKIPALNKSILLKLAKDIGKVKTLSIFIEHYIEDIIKINVILEINTTGTIKVSTLFPEPFEKEKTEQILRDAINPVLTIIKEFIEQSGYSLDLFNNLDSNFIELIDLKYDMLITIQKNLNLDKFIGCISNSFNIIENDLKKGIILRYKRVSNFNLMSSQNALIIELVNKGVSRNEIISSLVQNFNIEKEEAAKKYIDFVSEVEIERGLYENKRLKIRDNPGFLTTIKIDSFTNNILIEVSNIDNINYLFTVPKILYSTILLTQNTYNPIYKKNILELCKKKIKEIKFQKDIIAPAEQEFANNKRLKINDLQQLTFEEQEEVDEGDDEYLQQLLDQDSDDEENLEEGNDFQEKNLNSLGGASPSVDDIELGSSIGSDSDSDSDSNSDSDSDSDSDSENEETPKQEGNIVTEPVVEDLLNSKEKSLNEDEVQFGDSINSSSSSSPPSPSVDGSQSKEDEVELGNSIDSSSPKPAEDEVELGNSIDSSSPEATEAENEQSDSSDSSLSAISSLPSQPKEDDVQISNSIKSETLPSNNDDIQSKESIVSSLSRSKEDKKELADSLSTSKSKEEDDSNSNLNLDIKEDLDSSSESEDEEDDFERDITGIQLSNPNYFSSRMEKRDPVLFEKSKDDQKFKAYSRMCPSNVRRQPVILTQKEKENIDKHHPGSYDHAIKYGSNPNKQYYYICPRYWCLKDNTSLTEEEVERGVCGGRDAIIPEKATKVPAGKYIYEFNAKREHKNSDGSYIQHSPGFFPKNKNEKNLCLPCCFKNWNAPEQQRRRSECSQQTVQQTAKPLPVKRINASLMDDYIKDENKFPLEPNRWGYLPFVLQTFLRVDKKSCNSSNNTIPVNTECLLRHGVELNQKQSFVACIADLYVSYSKKKQIPSIKEMKEFIIKSLDLDIFISCNNGNLVQIFSKNIPDDIDIIDFELTTIYQSLNLENPLHMDYIKFIIGSYLNFINYLKSDDVKIDYNYLWDIICDKNEKLFPNGINLIILEIGTNDSTNNVELICPSNHYSKIFYSPRKSSFILLKNGDYYEPIYLYKDTLKEVKVQKTFNEYSKSAMPSNLKIILGLIKKYLNNNCKPLPSLPRVYKFDENKNFNEILNELEKIKPIAILGQIMNYNSKIIGILVSIENIKGVVPCYPSGYKIDSLPIKFIDDDIWNNYESTMAFLLLVTKKNPNIKCKPRLKVIDDELVVGIITETNQFIQIKQPEQPVNDGLEEINETNYLLTDKETLLSKKYDKERILYVKKIKLEKNFYDVFRNSLRIEINNYENRLIRENIINIIRDEKTDYYTKMENLISVLHNLLDKLVEFTNYSDNSIEKIDRITNCSISTTCDKSFCMRSDENNTCKLLIPKINLLNKLDNQITYFAKLADELLRYNRINSYIFNPKSHLTFGDLNYNLNDNEIILLSSLLNQDYFKDLIPVINNKYISTNTYDTAEPVKSQTYSLMINEESNSLKKINCDLEILNKITGKWNEWFSKDCKEVIYENNNICTFSVIIDILHNFKEYQDVTINSIKSVLLVEYKLLFKTHTENLIYSILSNQGKINEMKQIKTQFLKFEDYVLSENYYLTNLDIWILALHYKVGITLLSSTKLIENKNNILPLYYPKNQEYFFIKSPGIKKGGVNKNNIPKYRLIVNKDLISSFKLEELFVKLKTLIIASKTLTGKGFTLTNFIKNFQPVVYIQKRKIPKLKLVSS